jgi:hypothetical protein
MASEQFSDREWFWMLEALQLFKIQDLMNPWYATEAVNAKRMSVWLDEKTKVSIGPTYIMCRSRREDGEMEGYCWYMGDWPFPAEPPLHLECHGAISKGKVFSSFKEWYRVRNWQKAARDVALSIQAST